MPDLLLPQDPTHVEIPLLPGRGAFTVPKVKIPSREVALDTDDLSPRDEAYYTGAMDTNQEVIREGVAQMCQGMPDAELCMPRVCRMFMQ
jgi:hypothetical protein